MIQLVLYANNRSDNKEFYMKIDSFFLINLLMFVLTFDQSYSITYKIILLSFDKLFIKNCQLRHNRKDLYFYIVNKGE